MATLYELTGELLQLAEMLEDGEYDEEMIRDTMDSVEYDLEEKAEGYAKIIRNYEADIAAMKAEEKRLRERRSTLENSVKRLKDNLQDAMTKTGKTKFKRGVFSFAIQKNGGKLPVIIDSNKLPKELMIVTERPNMDAIADYIKEHPKTKLAHFGERGETLRIR